MFMRTFMVLQVLSSRILLVRYLKTEIFSPPEEKTSSYGWGWDVSQYHAHTYCNSILGTTRLMYIHVKLYTFSL